MLCSISCKNVATCMDVMQVLLLQVLNLMPEVGKFTPETRWMHRQVKAPCRIHVFDHFWTVLKGDVATKTDTYTADAPTDPERQDGNISSNFRALH